MDEWKCYEQVQAIALAAAAMLQAAKPQSIHLKGDVANLVSDMDVKLQDYLIEQLSSLPLDACFIAEEKQNEALSMGYTWVIDPIDGTTNFAYGYHHSAISIALIKDCHPLFGVCVNPYLNELFCAFRHKGAYCNGTPIHVSDRALGDSLILCGTAPYEKQRADESFAVMKQLFLKGRDIRRSGSAVLDLCYMACGRIDAFYEAALSFWDYAAASLIVQEAGGIIQPLNGAWGSLTPVGILAANSTNHASLCELIQFPSA